MPDTKFPYLCGGVLYFFLAQTKASKGTARDHRNSIKDDHSDPVMMGDLVHTFTGDFVSQAGKDTSLYRECHSEGTVNVPFNNTTVVSTYDTEVKFRYNEALERMTTFVSAHLNSSKYEWLVRALLDIIDQDSDISDNDNFFIKSDGSPATKADLRNMDSYEIEPFMVGIVHYILTRRMNCNHYGITTLEIWGEKKTRKERTYTGNAGVGITRKITVKQCPTPAVPEPENEKMPQDEPEASEAEYIEAEIIDDETAEDQAPEPDGRITVIHHQTNVIQNGPNNNQFTNNGTMIFDFRKGGK